MVVSHERVPEVLQSAFALLPDEVVGILEVGSRDAYRSMDSFIGREPISRDEFISGWRMCESFLLEDGSVGAGANADEPYLEVFLDQWKGVAIHVPIHLRDDVEDILQGLGLEEVAATWPMDDGDERASETTIRPVLVIEDEYSPDIDEILLELRSMWQLELNVDPETNVDEAGRELGLTLWHAVVIVESESNPTSAGGYVSVWATAKSLAEVDGLVDEAIDRLDGWRFVEVYATDRVAFDERPDELADLAPKRSTAEVHLVSVDVWETPPDQVRHPRRDG